MKTDSTPQKGCYPTQFVKGGFYEHNFSAIAAAFALRAEHTNKAAQYYELFGGNPHEHKDKDAYHRAV